MIGDVSQASFFSLLKAGLWEQSVRLSPYSSIDFDELYKLAEEQSVVGLLAAGLEHVEDMALAKQQVLPFMKQVFALENRNESMNGFIATIVEKMSVEGILTLLVKGQGIAQCYERPSWRSAGDIDFLLSEENYSKAKGFLLPLASSIEEEDVVRRHFGMTIGSWNVELHGALHCDLSGHINDQTDTILSELFEKGDFRIWHNGGVDVYLPGVNEDAVFVFTHILHHFFYGGIGLRQLCDWARLLWTYRDTIDRTLLEKRITQMNIMAEWKAFGAFAVDYLGIHVEALPFYDPSPRWRRKARRICSFILQVGNFGHNRDRSYFKKYPYLIRKTISFHYILNDFLHHLIIFPRTSLRVFGRRLKGGTEAVVKGK